MAVNKTAMMVGLFRDRVEIGEDDSVVVFAPSSLRTLRLKNNGPGEWKYYTADADGTHDVSASIVLLVQASLFPKGFVDNVLHPLMGSVRCYNLEVNDKNMRVVRYP